jgi:hypothetical protein
MGLTCTDSMPLRFDQDPPSLAEDAFPLDWDLAQKANFRDLERLRRSGNAKTSGKRLALFKHVQGGA